MDRSTQRGEFPRLTSAKTRREKTRNSAAAAKRQRANVRSSNAAHAAGAPFAAHPALTGQDGPAALLYVPQGINLDLP